MSKREREAATVLRRLVEMIDQGEMEASVLVRSRLDGAAIALECAGRR